MVFGVIVFFELFFALSCRSFTHNIDELGLFGNKTLLYSLLGESAATLLIMNYSPMQELFLLFKLPPTRGKIFVHDVLQAYDLASKTAGESVI
jgi:magnesium-transporting ATPase (P-type)